MLLLCYHTFLTFVLGRHIRGLWGVVGFGGKGREGEGLQTLLGPPRLDMGHRNQKQHRSPHQRS